jgi:hypothetical protein
MPVASGFSGKALGRRRSPASRGARNHEPKTPSHTLLCRPLGNNGTGSPVANVCLAVRGVGLISAASVLPLGSVAYRSGVPVEFLYG